MAAVLRTVLIDSDGESLASLRRMLATTASAVIVGEFGSVAEALVEAPVRRPDLVVVEIPARQVAEGPESASKAFQRFAAAHPVGSLAQGTVEGFASHGAYVIVNGVRSYIPLSAMDDPAPNAARQVLDQGETREFMVDGHDWEREGLDLAIPGFESDEAKAAPHPKAPVPVDEPKRRRYLSADELGRLAKALAEHEDQQAANVVRLLLLTGARIGETLAAKWADIDFTKKVWNKPGSTPVLLGTTTPAGDLGVCSFDFRLKDSPTALRPTAAGTVTVKSALGGDANRAFALL